MSQISRVIKSIANIFILSVPVIGMMYIMKGRVRPYFPLPIYLEIKALSPFIMMAFFLLFIPALFLSTPRMIYKIVLSSIMLPMIYISGIVMLDTEFLLNSVQTDNYRYNLIVHHEIGDNYRTCHLLKCNVNDLECKEIRSFIGNCWSLEKSGLVITPNTKEINVFMQVSSSRGYNLVYTYGVQPRMYTDKLSFGEFDYYLAYFKDYDNDSVIFKQMLYKCKKDDVSCERLPFRYDTVGLPISQLKLNRDSNEIEVYIDGTMIYTYGASPKCHVEGCFISTDD